MSLRRKNMARDVLCQILDLAGRRYGIGDLTLGLKVFRNAQSPTVTASILKTIFTRSLRRKSRRSSPGGGLGAVADHPLFFHGTAARRGTGTNLEQCVRRRWSPYRHPSPWAIWPDQAENNASRRKVQFGPRVRAQLVAQRRRVELISPHVFPNRMGAALNQRWMSQQVWRRVLRRAEVAYRQLVKHR